MNCPRCGHPHGGETISRGGWFWRPLLIRCGHQTVDDAASGWSQDVEVCACADGWHGAA